MIIEQPARFLRWLYPNAIWRMDLTEKKVYLTFDDGPIPEATPFVLEELRKRGIKATFFVVADNVRKYPEIFRQVIADGHSIGNHTFHHMGGARHHYRNYLKDIDEGNQILLANGMTANKRGQATKLFRPPHGWMRPSQYARLSNRYRIVMWDLVTRDYSRRLTAGDVVDNVKRLVRNGSIITFHDSLRSIAKLQTALPEALDWLIGEGYEFGVLPMK